MKKIFFHNEAIIKRGHPIINFFILTKGKANVLNSNGSNFAFQGFVNLANASNVAGVKKIVNLINLKDLKDE